MPYNYSKLRGKVAEKYGTKKSFSSAFGCTEATLSKMFSGKVEWNQSRIARACLLLEIPDAEIADYFFTADVKKSEQ